MPPSQRPLRVGEELRHALAGIFARGELRDPDLVDVTLTVTEVLVSPDLKSAIGPISLANVGEVVINPMAVLLAKRFPSASPSYL